MTAIPDMLLAAFYWMYMIATVIWLGGLAVIIFWIFPAERTIINDDRFAPLLVRAARLMSRVAWLSLILLGVSGMFQMSAHEKYQGIMQIANTWSVVLFIKHLVILGMAAVMVVVNLHVLPAIDHVVLRHQAGRSNPANSFRDTQTRLVALLRIICLLGMVVLGLTAVARIQ